MNFLDYIGESPSLTITTNGHAVVIKRARFGLHLRLSMIAGRINKICDGESVNINASDISDDIRQYLLLSGIDERDIDEMDGVEAIITYLQVSAFNSIQVVPAFMKAIARDKKEEPESKPLPYHYDGRYWAWFIATLASRYGWSEAEILELTPEAAMYYLQEALVMEYNDAEFRHQLSDVAYGYDAESKKPIYHPLPMPHWMSNDIDEKPQKFRIRRDFLPVGTIVTAMDLEKK